MLAVSNEVLGSSCSLTCCLCLSPGLPAQSWQRLQLQGHHWSLHGTQKNMQFGLECPAIVCVHILGVVAWHSS